MLPNQSAGEKFTMTDSRPEPSLSNNATGRVLVVGSVNHDHFLIVNSLPAAGETVTARKSSDGLGGKGANQAVAATLAGADVTFAGAVGNDPSGAFAEETLARHGVDCRSLHHVDGATGAAYIAVDAAGENTIIVLPGANSTVGVDVLEHSEGVRPALVLTQGEVPLAGIAAAAQFASDRGSIPPEPRPRRRRAPATTGAG